MNYLEFQEKIKLLNEELIKTNGNIVLLPKNIRSLGTELSEKNPELVDEIGYLTKHDLTKEEREEIINKMLEKKLKSIDDKKELISNVFSIDIKDIKEVSLPNEKNVIILSTFDVPIVIENTSDLNMVNLFKKMQAENGKFQSDNSKKNTEEIINSIGKDNKAFLQMIFIDKLDEYETIIRQLPDEEYNNFKKFVSDISIKNQTLKNDEKILYFNIENQFAVARNGKVYQVKKIMENGKEKIVIDENKGNEYSEDNYESIKYNDNQKIINNDDIVINDTYEKELNTEEIEKNDDEVEIKPEDLFENDENYIQLTDEEKKEVLKEIIEVANKRKETSNQYIKDYAELYNKKIEEKKKELENKKVRTLKLENTEKGFISILFITLVLLILIFIITLNIIK